MVFDVQQGLTKNDLRALDRAILRMSLRSGILSIFSSIFVGVPFFAVGIINLWHIPSAIIRMIRQQPDALTLPSLFLALVFTIAITDIGSIILFRVELFSFFFSWNRYRFKGVEFTYHFDADGFAEQSQFGSSQFFYPVLLQLAEDRARYFLFIHKNAAHIIRKDSFIQGDPEQFRSFIQQRTGKPVERI